MPLGFLGNIFGSAISAGASAANTRQINEMNYKIAQETNANNRLLVQMQNEAAKQEAEMAYKRSSASNQVNLMRAAGMSRAGAINALNGGGSYTPAPVNTSQDSAPQIQTTDFSALANIGQGLEAISQRKHEEKMQAKQLAAQKEEAAKQREHELLLKDIDTANITQGHYIDYNKHKEQLDFDKKVYQDAAPLRKRQLEELDARISNLNAQTNNTKVQTALYDLEYELSAENLDIKKIRSLAEQLSAISQSQLDILTNQTKTNAINTLDPVELNNYMQYKMRMELVSLISNAIKEQEWSGPNANRNLSYLKLVENLVIRK